MSCKSAFAFTVLAAATAVMPRADHASASSGWLAAQAPANRLIFVQTQTSHSTEAILRKTIADLQQGKPDFDSMEPQLQSAIKEQSKSTADIYRHLGALQTLKYVATQNGAD